MDWAFSSIVFDALPKHRCTIHNMIVWFAVFVQSVERLKFVGSNHILDGTLLCDLSNALIHFCDLLGHFRGMVLDLFVWIWFTLNYILVDFKYFAF